MITGPGGLSRQFPETAHFFGAYFHQDWRCDASTYQEVLQQFAEDEPDALGRLVTELEQVQDEMQGLSCEQANLILRRLRSAVNPRGFGLSPQEWLERIIAYFSAQGGKA